MSKAELARNAGISSLTIDRIEKGMRCRIETKRKIILAFGYDLSDKSLIFKNGWWSWRKDWSDLFPPYAILFKLETI